MKRALETWQGFWFRPAPTSTLALVRIAFGVLIFLWTLSLAPDLFPFFASDGLLPDQPAAQGPALWTVLGISSSHIAVLVLYFALLLASLALIIGLWTRLASVIVFVAVVSFERRNPFVFNSGDGLVRLIALFLALAPAGASLSVDRLRRARDRFWEFPERSPWALRFLQIMVSVIYLSTVWQKVRGVTWNDGTAVSYALRIEDLQRFPVPGPLSDSVLLSNLETYATLATELSLGVLVWSRRARKFVIPLGIGMHLSIDYSIRVGFFSYAMLILYIAFIPPDTAARWILWARKRFFRRRLRRRPAVA